MEKLMFDLNEKYAKFRMMNCVNNGPVHKRHAEDQRRSNLEAYKSAKIPFARNHDAAFWAGYGGEYSVDISAVFPNFDADEYDENSYDFACTDEYILVTLDANTKTYYRLGQKIEHYIKKFHIYPPEDYKKWAVICEHIIRHYTQGWANGYKLDMPYWEIWNEPDLDDGQEYKRTWTGTKMEFFELFETTIAHLKKCFPDLKIGGPALAEKEDWADDFLRYMKEKNVPIDFFSWHIYSHNPIKIREKGERIRAIMEKYGYGNAESHLNEWNYVKGWADDDFIYSIKAITGLKGSSFALATMAECQKCDKIDMLMYYDARPCVFNGLFDFYTYTPLKGYYPFKWYGMFYDCESEVRCKNEAENIYTLCGVNKDGKALAMLTYFNDDDKAESKTVCVNFGRKGIFEVYILDENRSAELLTTTSDLTFELPLFTSLLIKEI